MAYEAMLVALAYFLNPKRWVDLLAREGKKEQPLSSLLFALDVMTHQTTREEKSLRGLVYLLRSEKGDILSTAEGRVQVRDYLRFYSYAGGFDEYKVFLEMCPDMPGLEDWCTEYVVGLRQVAAAAAAAKKLMEKPPTPKLKKDAKSKRIRKDPKLVAVPPKTSTRGAGQPRNTAQKGGQRK